jgi:leucyl aminopeptidase
MEVSIKAAGAAAHPHRIVPVFSPPRKGFRLAGTAPARAAEALAKMRKFTGGAGETLLLPQGATQWLFAGLGPKKELTRQVFCTAVGRALKELRGAGAEQISLLLPDELPWQAGEAARWAAEALGMAGYAFNTYRTGSNGPPPCRVELVRAGDQVALRRGIKAGQAVAEGVALARDLINHPAAVAHTDFMLAEVRKLGKRTGAQHREIRGDRLLREGYEALHAVGRAAAHPPALAALEYGRAGRGRPSIALVGKGVVFDSGGLDLKTAAGMAMMKKDMGGAAIVMGAFQAIAALRLPVHLVAVVGLAENAVGPLAYHPGDVLRSKRGLTIEITNTDAEGRVVLADAYALAHRYKPRYLIDFATLTGACRIALGKDLMGLFCNDPTLQDALVAGGEATGDHVWPMPLWEPYRKKLDSSIADLANAASDGMGGAITAAMFLKEFAGDVAWAHMDCYAWSDGDQPLFPKGGSGVGVRLMVELATRLSQGDINGGS